MPTSIFKTALALGVAALCGTAFAQQTQITRPITPITGHHGLLGAPVTTDISGFNAPQSSNRRTLNGTTGKFGLYGLEFGERGDRACFLEAFRENTDVASEDNRREVVSICGSNGVNNGSKKLVSFRRGVPNEERSFATGLEICLNNNNNRLKGIRIFAKTIDESNRLVAMTPPPPNGNGLIVATYDRREKKRNNCNANWRGRVDCPDDMIATGIVAHLSGSSDSDSVIGLALRCKRWGRLIQLN